MAKKPSAKKSAKKTAKKAAKKPAARKSTASKAASTTAAKPKPSAKKTASKKSAAKKTEAMTTTAQSTPKKKPATKKAAAKKPTKKPATAPADASTPAKSPTTKKTARKVAKKPAAKSETKPAASKKKSASAESKPVASKSGTKKPAGTTAPKSNAKTDAKNETADDKKSGRKGITIVQPAKKPASRGKAVSKHIPPVRPMLLGPGSKLNKPLIPSGPSAPKPESALETPKSRRTKSPLTKAKLEKFRQLLLAKRAELLGDVVSMENEALRSESGGLSNNPQHIAEQGSENYDQTLSLNLAAQDRKRIKEIDEALGRIEDGTYGLCELTNLPIPEERLEELPWARYTIEAARQLEKNRGLSS